MDRSLEIGDGIDVVNMSNLVENCSTLEYVETCSTLEYTDVMEGILSLQEVVPAPVSTEMYPIQIETLLLQDLMILP